MLFTQTFGGSESGTIAKQVLGEVAALNDKVTVVEKNFVLDTEDKAKYGVDTMPETAENIAEDFGISRADQDAFAFRTQQRWAKAQAEQFFANELIPEALEAGKSILEKLK